MPKLLISGRSWRWLREAGTRFRRFLRQTAEVMSSEANRVDLGPSALAELFSQKIHGVASKELAEAVKNFNEAKRTGIGVELDLRLMESKVKTAEAESRLAEVSAVKAEAELIVTLRQLGLEMRVDDSGLLTVLPREGSASTQEVEKVVEQQRALLKRLRAQLKSLEK